MFSLPVTAEQVQIPASRDLGGGGEGALAGRLADQFSLNEGAGGDEGAAVAALETELPFVEFRDDFGGFGLRGCGCHMP